MNFNDYKIPETYGVSFEVTYINVGDHYHRIATAGNPSGIPVIVIYSTLQTKKESGFNRFVIVSKSLHWTHIERPENVAYPRVDFIKDVEKN